MKKLDRNRPLGEIFGGTPNGARYVQDGVEFDGAGNEIGGKKAAKPDPAPKQEDAPSEEPEEAVNTAPDVNPAGPDYASMKASELKALVAAAGGDYTTKKDAVAFLTAKDADN